MKKIEISSIDTKNSYTGNVDKLGKKLKRKTLKVKLPEQKPDKFEYSEDWKIRDEMGNMQFKATKIEFYPEDIEKMKSMSDEEMIDYAIKLRQEKRYNVIKD